MPGGLACTCGSLLPAGLCCASDGAAPVPEAALLEAEAIAAHYAGEAALAGARALACLGQDPLRVGALGVLAELRAQQGEAKAHEALLRRIVALDANNVWGTNRLTLLLLARGDLAEAERHARNAVRIAPEDAQPHYLLGLVLTEGFRPAYGEYHLRRALEIAGPHDAVLFANLGLCLKNQGKMGEARAAYAQSLALAPGAFGALLGLARLEEADRDLTAALAWLDRADEAEPGHPGAMLLRATILGRQSAPEAALALLDGMAEGRAALSVAEWLEKGRLLDRMGRHAAAFDAFAQGKALLREATGQAYQAAAAQSAAERLRGFFTRRRLRTLPRAGTAPDSPQPLFVLGFPRSGTTLLEQTLSAHSRICAGDELPIVTDITQLMPRMLDSPLGYPEALAELWMADHRAGLDNLRDFYMQRVGQLGIPHDAAAWFTDKMPLNEMHLGLIALLFPGSPLLHVVRHPLDVVLSVFSNQLTHGYCCAYAMQSVAAHYVLVMDLVEHYRREMALRYLQVRYEAMVEDQEATIRGVLDFVGEDFEAGCLDFHDNRRYARTASYAQVSEKLYARSRYRYLNYLPQLAPVIPMLEETIGRLGYAV